MSELVSQSLQALKEFENQKISYQVTIGELFDQVIERTHKLFPECTNFSFKDKRSRAKYRQFTKHTFAIYSKRSG